MISLPVMFSDVEKLSTFSQRFPLPSMYRIHVWKVLLGENMNHHSQTSPHAVSGNDGCVLTSPQVSCRPTAILTPWCLGVVSSSLRTSVALWRPCGSSMRPLRRRSFTSACSSWRTSSFPAGASSDRQWGWFCGFVGNPLCVLMSQVCDGFPPGWWGYNLPGYCPGDGGDRGWPGGLLLAGQMFRLPVPAQVWRLHPSPGTCWPVKGTVHLTWTLCHHIYIYLC